MGMIGRILKRLTTKKPPPPPDPVALLVKHSYPDEWLLDDRAMFLGHKRHGAIQFARNDYGTWMCRPSSRPVSRELQAAIVSLIKRVRDHRETPFYKAVAAAGREKKLWD